MSNVLTPRNWPGMNDRANMEFYKWMIAVSGAIGVAPPQSLSELSEQSLSPVLSRIKQLESEVDSLKRALNRKTSEAEKMRIRIEDLERSI